MKKILFSSAILATTLVGVGAITTIENTTKYVGITQSQEVLPEISPPEEDIITEFGGTNDFTFKYNGNENDIWFWSKTYPEGKTDNQTVADSILNTDFLQMRFDIITDVTDGVVNKNVIQDWYVFYPAWTEGTIGAPYIFNHTPADENGNGYLYVLGETLTYDSMITMDVANTPLNEEDDVWVPESFNEDQGPGYSKVKERENILSLEYNNETFFLFMSEEDSLENNLVLPYSIAIETIYKYIVEYMSVVDFHFLDNGNNVIYNEHREDMVNGSYSYNANLSVKINDKVYYVDNLTHKNIPETNIHTYSAANSSNEEYSLGSWFQWKIVTNEALMSDDGLLNDFSDDFQIALFRDDKNPGFYYDGMWNENIGSTYGLLDDLSNWVYRDEYGFEAWSLETTSDIPWHEDNITIVNYEGTYKEVASFEKINDNAYNIEFVSGETYIYANGVWTKYDVAERKAIENNDYIQSVYINDVLRYFGIVNDKFVEFTETTSRAFAANDIYEHSATVIEDETTITVLSTANDFESINNNTTFAEKMTVDSGLSSITGNDIQTLGVSGTDELINLIQWAPTEESQATYYVVDSYNLDENGNGTISIITSTDLQTGEKELAEIQFENGSQKELELNEEESESIEVSDIIEAVGADIFLKWINSAFDTTIEEVPEEVSFTTVNAEGEEVVLDYETEYVVENTTFDKLVYYPSQDESTSRSEANEESVQPITIYQFTFYDPNEDFTYMLPVTTGGLWNMAANATTTVEKIAAYAIIMMVYLLAILVLALVASGATWIGFRIKRGYY